MPLRFYQTFALPGNRQSEYYYNETESSWINGKLRRDLQQPHTLIHTHVKQWRKSDPAFFWDPSQATAGDYQSDFVSWGPIENEAIARWNRQLRQNSSANLGVTLASWGKAREMIVDRFGKVQKILSRTEKRLSNSRAARKRYGLDSLANDILEVQFGWKPLFGDIKSALEVLGGDTPPHYVTARKRATISGVVATGVKGQPFNPYRVWTAEGYALCSLCGVAVVTNQNLWLANKLGLINPATVIWDRIPWSFLVNMFVNCNQMINSVTDEVGLSISNKSTTKTSYLAVENMVTDPAYPGYASSLVVRKAKRRVVGSHPTVTWQVRVPKVDWNLAAIASALVVQQSYRISRLIR